MVLLFQNQSAPFQLLWNQGSTASEKSPKKEEKEIKEATVSPAVASEMGGDAAAVPVLLELDVIFTLQEEQSAPL